LDETEELQIENLAPQLDRRKAEIPPESLSSIAQSPSKLRKRIEKNNRKREEEKDCLICILVDTIRELLRNRLPKRRSLQHQHKTRFLRQI
jgi:hypothetical protein